MGDSDLCSISILFLTFNGGIHPFLVVILTIAAMEYQPVGKLVKCVLK